jgi:phosphoribosylaminoimidazole-succinocarboxamide synthase
VRGYLAGSGWAEYKEMGTVGGIALRAGLHEGDALDEPLFTPATKAALGDHDENITFDRMVEIVGASDAHALREASVSIYQRARDIAARRGVILADTKFEFGRNPTTGAITLADEILTPDSSRYWDGETYAAGGINRLDSFDKQLVRNWLASNWDRKGSPPRLPDELVELTRQRYGELFDRLTGSTLEG